MASTLWHDSDLRSNNKLYILLPDQLNCLILYYEHFFCFLGSSYAEMYNLRLVCIDVHFSLALYTIYANNLKKDYDSKTISSAYNSIPTVAMPVFKPQCSLLMLLLPKPLINKVEWWQGIPCFTPD